MTPDSSLTSKLHLVHKPNISRVSTAAKSVQHSESPPKTAEVAIQTMEASIRDYDREDLLELLRELVVTPRQHLDAVMEQIEKDLCQSDVSYNKMLKDVHKFSAMEVKWCVFSGYCHFVHMKFIRENIM